MIVNRTRQTKSMSLSIIHDVNDLRGHSPSRRRKPVNQIHWIDISSDVISVRLISSGLFKCLKIERSSHISWTWISDPCRWLDFSPWSCAELVDGLGSAAFRVTNEWDRLSFLDVWHLYCMWGILDLPSAAGARTKITISATVTHSWMPFGRWNSAPSDQVT